MVYRVRFPTTHVASNYAGAHKRNEDGMSKYVTISGRDLDYFKSIVSDAISGEYGDVSEVRIAVSDSGMTIGANGYVSNQIGTVQSDPESDSATAQIIESSNGSREPEVLGDILKRVFKDVKRARKLV